MFRRRLRIVIFLDVYVFFFVLVVRFVRIFFDVYVEVLIMRSFDIILMGMRKFWYYFNVYMEVERIIFVCIKTLKSVLS